jgi:hypothetical protein
MPDGLLVPRTCAKVERVSGRRSSPTSLIVRSSPGGSAGLSGILRLGRPGFQLYDSASMNAKIFRVFTVFQLVLFAGAARLHAEATDGVICVTNSSLLQEGFSLTLLTNEMSMPGGILVYTNGTFSVNGGRHRQLLDGQVLRPDGFLLNPDGSIIPVRDHLTMTSATVTVFKDGEASTLSSPLTLPDGTTVNPDGSYTRPGGQSRLVDGQMVTLAGESLAGLSTISMKNGRVVVFKSATLIPLEASNVIMGMFDGTRVNAAGLVTFHDGNTLQLAENQVITVPGVRASW